MAFHPKRKRAAAARAIEAFEYGVRDFVPQPFGRERVERTLPQGLRKA